VVADFKTDPASASSLLSRLFKACLSQNQEGLIVKDASSRYCPGDRSHWLKLKKDYIEGFGDTAEFAVIGVSGHPDRPGFYSNLTVAVIKNKEEMEEEPGSALPHLVALFNVSVGLSEAELKLLQPILKERFSLQKPTKYMLEFGPGFAQKPDILLSTPLVVELLGSGFVKERGQPYWSLRFPRIRKVFVSRAIGDILSFEELQDLGENGTASVTVGEDVIRGSASSRQHKIQGFSSPTEPNNLPQRCASTTPTTPSTYIENVKGEQDVEDAQNPNVRCSFEDTQDYSVLAKESQSTERFALIPPSLHSHSRELEQCLRRMGYLIVHTVDALLACSGERAMVVEESMPWIRRRLSKMTPDGTQIILTEMSTLLS
jgi:hypothetical protein